VLGFAEFAAVRALAEKTAGVFMKKKPAAPAKRAACKP
jgi:hypothetical protein